MEGDIVKRSTILLITILGVIMTAFTWYGQSIIEALQTDNLTLKHKNTELISQNEQLEMQLRELNKEISSLQERISFSPEAYFPWQEYPYKYRFVTKETYTYGLPLRNSNTIWPLSPGRVLPVVSATVSQGDDVWLLVDISYTDVASNRGWILESDTEPITVENQKQAIDVILKTGAMIYEVDNFGEITTTSPTTTEYDHSVLLISIKDGWAHIGVGGGSTVWVEEKFIEYPPIDGIKVWPFP